jgi:hypothetical protein
MFIFQHPPVSTPLPHYRNSTNYRELYHPDAYALRRSQSY